MHIIRQKDLVTIIVSVATLQWCISFRIFYIKLYVWGKRRFLKGLLMDKIQLSTKQNIVTKDLIISKVTCLYPYFG